MWIVFTLAFLIGIYLIWIGGWPILAVGVLAIITAIAYTGGPFPLGYHGLGEIFVFIFFGPVAVCGTYYVQAGYISASAWWASIPMGFLISAVLVVNNFRDLETDKEGGKRTLAVRLGYAGTQREYYLIIIASLIVPLLMWLSGEHSAWILLPWVSLFLVRPLIHDMQTKKGVSLNATLAGTARLSLVFGILLSIGYLIDKINFILLTDYK
jgi:1,4-dihydroxy-2-naphthoate octaprenyltransferase